jgi:hypothetical protein
MDKGKPEHGDLASTAKGSGARFSAGKPKMHLVPLHLLESTARVLEHGSVKYAPWNWAKGMPWSVPYDCALRHLAAWFRGEDTDPETGESPLAHVVCNLLMLLQYEQHFREGDDRPLDWFQRNGGVDGICGVSADPGQLPQPHESGAPAADGATGERGATRGHAVRVKG